jgi:hypothetical protein
MLQARDQRVEDVVTHVVRMWAPIALATHVPRVLLLMLDEEPIRLDNEGSPPLRFPPPERGYLRKGFRRRLERGVSMNVPVLSAGRKFWMEAGNESVNAQPRRAASKRPEGFRHATQRIGEIVCPARDEGEERRDGPPHARER